MVQRQQNPETGLSSKAGSDVAPNPYGFLVSIANFIPGAWLVIAPFVLGYTTSQAIWNDELIGLVLMIAALVRFHRAFRGDWLSYLRMVLGLWLIIASFVLHDTTPQAHWNDVIVGIVVLAVTIWTFALTRSSHLPPPLPRAI